MGKNHSRNGLVERPLKWILFVPIHFLSQENACSRSSSSTAPWAVAYSVEVPGQASARLGNTGDSGLIHLLSSFLNSTNLHPDKPSSTFDGVTVSRPLAAAVYSFRFRHHIIYVLEPDRCFDAEAHIVLDQSREIFSTGVPVCTSHQLPLVVSGSDLAMLATWPSISHQW